MREFAGMHTVAMTRLARQGHGPKNIYTRMRTCACNEMPLNPSKCGPSISNPRGLPLGHFSHLTLTDEGRASGGPL